MKRYSNNQKRRLDNTQNLLPTNPLRISSPFCKFSVLWISRLLTPEECNSFALTKGEDVKEATELYLRMVNTSAGRFSVKWSAYSLFCTAGFLHPNLILTCCLRFAVGCHSSITSPVSIKQCKDCQVGPRYKFKHLRKAVGICTCNRGLSVENLLYTSNSLHKPVSSSLAERLH